MILNNFIVCLKSVLVFYSVFYVVISVFIDFNIQNRQEKNSFQSQESTQCPSQS